MRAFSLRTLLIATAGVALCVVILGRPSLFWMRLTFSVTLATLAWWLVLALAGRGGRRFGVAAAVVGIGYLTIAFYATDRQQGSGGGYVLGRMLITHQVLEVVARLTGPEFTTLANELSLWDGETFSESTVVSRSAVGGFPGGGFANYVAVPGSPPMARYQRMLISGHCLFALLFGWMAGSAAKRWLEPEDDASGNGGPR